MTRVGFSLGLGIVYVLAELAFLLLNLGLIASDQVAQYQQRLDYASTGLIAFALWSWTVGPLLAPRPTAARILFALGGAIVAVPIATRLKTETIDVIAAQFGNTARLMQATLAGAHDSEARNQLQVSGTQYHISGDAPWQASVERVLLPVLLHEVVNHERVMAQILEEVTRRLEWNCAGGSGPSPNDCHCLESAPKLWQLGNTTIQAMPSARSSQLCAVGPMLDGLEQQYSSFRDAAAKVRLVCEQNATAVARAIFAQRMDALSPEERHQAELLGTDEEEEQLLATTRQTLATKCADARSEWRTNTRSQLGTPLPINFSRSQFENSPGVVAILRKQMQQTFQISPSEMPRGCKISTTMLRQDFVRCVHNPKRHQYIAAIRQRLHLTEADFAPGGRHYGTGDRALRGALAMVVAVGMSSVGILIGSFRVLIGLIVIAWVAWRPPTASAIRDLALLQWLLLITFCATAFFFVTRSDPPQVESISDSVVARALYSSRSDKSVLLRIAGWWAFGASELAHRLEANWPGAVN